MIKSDRFPFFGSYRIGWILFWGFILMMINGLVIGIVESTRGLTSGSLILFGVLSVVTGWTLGGAKDSKTWRLLIAITAILLILPFVQSGGIRSFWRVIGLFFREFPLITPTSFSPETISPVDQAIQMSFRQWFSFISNLLRWVLDYVRGTSAYDRSVTSFFWHSLVGISSLSMGWLIRRKKHTFISTLPVFIPLIAILGVSQKKTTGLLITLIALLCLIVLTEYLRKEEQWRAKKIDYSEEVRFDMGALALPVILVIILIAGVIPNIRIEDLRDFYQELFDIERQTSVNLTEPLGIEQATVESSDLRSGVLPRSHLINDPPELSNLPVMQIEIPEDIQLSEEGLPINLPSYYWFGRSYDIYTGQGWETSITETETISAGTPLINTRNLYTSQSMFTILKLDQTNTTLYTPGIPESVNRDIKLRIRINTEEYFDAQVNQPNYTVAASRLTVSEKALTEANLASPETITAAYLQLPETLPERVSQLALSITEQAPTPYLAAQAIESYLRQFEYDLQIPSPPKDQDIVDYFLFDLQKGYCDYYASAMVILSRASGLPARIAVGYSTGTYQPESNTLFITEAQAHSWAEIYIAPYGWITFEPTASMPLVARASETESNQIPDPVDSGEENNSLAQNWVHVLIVLGISAAVGMTYLAIRRLLLWMGLISEKKTSIKRFYFRMQAYLDKYHNIETKALTPLEYQEAVIQWLKTLIQKGKQKPWMDRVAKNIVMLTHLYQLETYSAHPITDQAKNQAKRSLQDLSRQFIKIRVLFLFRRTSSII